MRGGAGCQGRWRLEVKNVGVAKAHLGPVDMADSVLGLSLRCRCAGRNSPRQ